MNSDLWAYATAGLYWCLTLCWLIILLFYRRQYRRITTLSPILCIMLIILFLDGARTLLESLYFGTWYTARTGLIPRSLYDMLGEPHYVVVPKVLNLLAALMILILLLRRWFPALATELERQQHTERLCGELQEAHTSLQAAQTARDALTHMIVHDMRTPLTNIITGLQTLELEADASALTQELVGGALMGAERLLHMVNELLDIGKMEAGEMALVYECFPVQAVLKDTAKFVDALLRDKQLTLHQDFEEDPLDEDIVEADRQKILRVLINLVGNAIKFSPPGGAICLSAQRKTDTHICVSVTDSGPGIAFEHQSKIFDKFYQVESGSTRRIASTGLGLTFCKMVIEAHGGQIGVDSVPGKGSNFWFTLPCIRAIVDSTAS